MPGLLHGKGVSQQAAMMTSGLSDDDGCSSEDEQKRSSTSKHSRWSDLNEHRLGQVLGVDLWQVPKQDSARNTITRSLASLVSLYRTVFPRPFAPKKRKRTPPPPHQNPKNTSQC